MGSALRRRLQVCAGTLLLSAAAATAGSIEVELRLPGGRLMRGTPLLLHPPPDDPRTPVAVLLGQPGTYRAFTADNGVAHFPGVAPGRYTVSLPRLPGGIVPPAENPLYPAPVMTLFDDEETLQARLRLQTGIQVGVELGVPGPAVGFRAIFRHPASGLELAAPFLPQLPRIEMLLAPTEWEVQVVAPPGQLLVDVEVDRGAAAGHVAAIALEPGGDPVWLTWTYEAAATIEGEVEVEGGTPPQVTIVATLLEDGGWLAAVQRRGGSRFREVSARVDAGGRYRLRLPDGLWRLVPAAKGLLASEPTALDVELGVGDVERADFEVVLEEAPRQTFRVRVLDDETSPLTGAAVHLASLADPITVLRSGTTELFGVDWPVLPEVDALLLAGHADFLEARTELRDFRSQDVRQIEIELPKGAAFQLRTFDLDGRPADGVRWTIERLGAPPELLLADPAFVAAKNGRVATTDTSGRVRVEGFYGGRYGLGAQIPGHGRPGGLFRVGRPGDRPERWTAVELAERGVADLVAHQQPAANLRMQLLCDDGLPPPEITAALAVDLDAPAASPEQAWAAAAVRGREIPLVGRRRDELLLGPLAQGVYRLAVRPKGFERWTWAFEAGSAEAAHPIQLDVDEHAGNELVRLGDFPLECAPAVDLVPRSGAGSLPELRRVRVRARLLDPAHGHEIAPSPAAVARRGRFALRRLPHGRVRLEVVLSHRHFLPSPELTWETELTLERGRTAEVELRIEAVGGAVEVVGTAALARLVDAAGEAQTYPLDGRPTVFPSLAPGTYTVELCGDADCEPPQKRWPDVEVRRGETARLLEGVAKPIFTVPW